MKSGVCRYCCCEDHTPCLFGCAWTDDTRTLCTACRSAEVLAEVCLRVQAAAVRQTFPPIGLVTSAWSGLVFEQRQILVMAMRMVREEIARQVLEAQLGQEACR